MRIMTGALAFLASSAGMINEIAAASGLGGWEPGELVESDTERRIWRYIKTRADLAKLFLGYGKDDRFSAAHEMLAAMGAEAFAERARHELAATGETVRKRAVQTVSTLTPQEASIARLVQDGRTNPEIGVQLFLSARTVEWHLRKVFAKLGISSRNKLAQVLPPESTAAQLP